MEITDTIKAIDKLYKSKNFKSGNYPNTLALHSMVPQQEQNLVFKPPK